MITTTLESAPRITDALASVPALRDVLSPEAVIEHVGDSIARAGWEMLTAGSPTVLKVDAGQALITVGMMPDRAGWTTRRVDLEFDRASASNIASRCACSPSVPASCVHVAAAAFHLLGYPDEAVPLQSTPGGDAELFKAGRFEEYVDWALAREVAPAAVAAAAPTLRLYDYTIVRVADILDQVVSVPSFTTFTDLVRLDAFLALARLVAEYEPNVTRRFGETPGHGKTMSRLAAIYDSAVNHVEDIYARATEGLPFDERSELQALMAERNVRVVMSSAAQGVERAYRWLASLDYVAYQARPHLEAYAAFHRVAADQHRTATFHRIRAAAARHRATRASTLLTAM